MINKNNVAYIFLFLAALFWSGNFLVGKFASQYQIPPFSLNFYRWLFAWLILAPFTIQEILKKRNYILENYTFLKRPVIISNGKTFIGNSKKTIQEVKKHLSE